MLRQIYKPSLVASGMYAYFMLKDNVKMDQSGNVDNERPNKSFLLFLGTGSSVGSPSPYFLMNKSSFSVKSALGDPRFNKNYRCNPSLLIQYEDDNDSNEKKNIVIDVGKTFRETIIRWIPEYDIQTIDSIILTHGHADAIFGLDDVRAVQPNNPKEPMNVYLSNECLETVRQVLYYLVPTNAYIKDCDKESTLGTSSETNGINKGEKDEDGKVFRHVSTICWNLVKEFRPFSVYGLKFTPIPVLHGEDMISLGFIFGKKDKICYISDISRMPDKTLQVIQEHSPISILIVDALLMHQKHPTHFSMDQAIDLAMKIKPQKTLLVGMSGSIGDHDEINESLRLLLVEKGLDVQLAHDGLRIDVDL